MNIGQHFSFKYFGEILKGTVIFTTKDNAVVLVHDGSETECSVRVMEAPIRAWSSVVKEISIDDIPNESQALLNKISSVKKGDCVSVCCDSDKDIFRGLLKKIALDGYLVSDGKEEYVYPFSSMIEKTIANDKPMPLDKWSCKKAKSNVHYHSGGLCQKYVLLYDGKKVLEVEENPYGAGYDSKALSMIDEKDPLEVLRKDSKESFEIYRVDEKFMFFSESEGCIAQWLLERDYVNLSDRFNKRP